MIVYVITNKINGKRYVGQTAKTLEERWAEHKSAARRGARVLFYNALRKHGPDAFWLGELGTRNTRAELSELECLWIARLGTLIPAGYNMTAGGEGALGYKHTPEVIEHLRRINTGRKPPPYEKMRLATLRVGVLHGETTRKKMSVGHKTSEKCRLYHIRQKEFMRGRIHSPETLLKMAEARRRYWANKKLTMRVSA